MSLREYCNILKFTFVLIFCFASFSYSQDLFLLSINQSTQFSIDRLGQQVYLKDFYSDIVRKVALNNLEETITNFLYIPPVLSNKNHLLLYGSKIYDLDKQTYRTVTNSSEDSLSYSIDSNFPGSFSPNDKNFMYGNPKNYISLEDSLLKPTQTAFNVYSIINYNVRDAYLQWSSDTSFVFLSGDAVIAEYFLKSKKLDTLVNFVDMAYILGFAYNVKHNILAYSTYGHPSQIYLHYKNSNSDSLVFSPFRDDASSPCWGVAIGFTSLTWSPDSQKLAFGVYHFTTPNTGIYLYSIDSNRTYKATSCDDYGLKTKFQWANNDTLIYVSDNDRYLYGIDLSSVITSVSNGKDDEILTYFTINQNYPNPFNPTTQIQYILPSSSNVIVTVYNSLGQTVKVFNEGTKEAGNHNITFNGEGLSSGIYLYSVHSVSIDGKQNFTAAKKMLLLK